LDSNETLELSNLLSSIILELLKSASNFAILASNSPCASFAASYSAFSERSPLSLASAI